MKLAMFVLLTFLLPTNWAVKTQTQVIVEPQQPPAIIPIEGVRRGDAVRLDVASVSAVAFGIVVMDPNTGRPVSNMSVCGRQRVTQASAECRIPADFSAIVIWDMRTIRIRQNRVNVTLSVAE